MKYIWSGVLTYVDICGKQTINKILAKYYQTINKHNTTTRKYITQIIITYQRL